MQKLTDLLILSSVFLFLPVDLSHAQVRQDWFARYAAAEGKTEYPAAMATDSALNTYIAATIHEGWVTAPSDILVLKYDSSGNLLWSKSYDGDGGSDQASDIGLDTKGNVYVLGSSYSAATNYDYVLLKYTSNGLQRWVERYDGPGSGQDYGEDLAIDDEGNICVTGESANTNDEGNLTTLMYDSTGEALWVRRYSTQSSSATGVAFDVQRNVIVVGKSFDTGSLDDITTIKYDRLGNQQWMKRFDGGGNDDAYSMTLDGSGNIHIAGTQTGGGGYTDFVILKYRSDGTMAWDERYYGPEGRSDRAYNIALDEGGNVYVSGPSQNSSISNDYLVIKYDSSGTEQWIQRYDGPNAGEDVPRSLAVTRSGKVYVTGTSAGVQTDADFATIHYDSAGNQQWVRRFNGIGDSIDGAVSIVLDQDLNIRVTGYSIHGKDREDIYTIMYDSSGTKQWEERYSEKLESSGSATASMTVTDRSGNIYVTGSSFAGSDNDYVTIKYSQAGEEEWTQYYDGGYNDIAIALAVDEEGNVYVTGESFSSAQAVSSGYITIKYSPEGVKEWVRRYDGPGNSTDTPAGITTNASGDVFVTGTSHGGSSTVMDIATVKYTSQGGQSWVNRYAGSGTTNDYAAGIVADQYGNIYVGGASADFVTIKYSPSGTQVWVREYNGPGGGYEYTDDIALDGDGNIYLAGTSYGGVASEDLAVLKYDPAGTLLWTQRYNGEANGSDQARALDVTSSGDVFLLGSVPDVNGFGTYVVVKYNSSGVRQWAQGHSASTIFDGPVDLAADDDGDVYVTGTSFISPSHSDYHTFKYDSSGVLQWTQSFDLNFGHDDPISITIDDQRGSVIVTGSSVDASQRQIITVKYGMHRLASIAVSAKWNLLSTPLLPPDAAKTALFPSSVSGAYAYDDGYSEVSELEIGRGYWLKFLSDESVTIEGFPFSAETVMVNAGWNIIGSVSVPVEAQSIGAIPSDLSRSAFFEYVGGYRVADTISPGKGYWVKLSGSGMLILSGNAGSWTQIPLSVAFHGELPPPPPSAERSEAATPTVARLYANYPNPFNPATTIAFDVPSASLITIKLYNMVGQEVARIVDEKEFGIGHHRLLLDGRELASGSYICGMTMRDILNGEVSERSVKVIALK